VSKINLNFLSIIGYAGQGKDTLKDLIAEHYTDNDFHGMSFAVSMKTQLGECLTDEVLSVSDLSPSDYEKNSDYVYNVVNDLKDNHPNTAIYEGLNCRELLQILGTNFYRDLDPDIHVRFTASSVLSHLEKMDTESSKNKNDYIFVSSDVRFPNEIKFLSSISQIKNRDDHIDFIKFFLKTAKDLPKFENFCSHFNKSFNKENAYNVDNFAKKLVDRMWKDVNVLRNVQDYKRDWSHIVPPKTKGISKEEAMKAGIIHIFRPILPIDKDFTNYNKAELVSEVSKFTSTPIDSVIKIKDTYEKYKVEFNNENIKNYGFLRADVRHYSEQALNDMKPKALMSMPFLNENSLEDYKNNVVNLIEKSINNKPSNPSKRKPKSNLI
jgi:hypothetical protein